MGRIKRELKRPDDKLNSNLIIIATEGRNTEKKYFNDLTSKDNFYTDKVHIIVISNIQDKSSPDHVMKQLNDFYNEYDLGENDELWLVIDRDRWPAKTLPNIARQCKQKNYNMALSNPCFELWILLHLKDVYSLSKSEKERLLLNRKVSATRTTIEKEIISILGSYNKSNIDISKIIQHTNVAIDRAIELDRFPSHRWPNYLATRVYKFVKTLINS
ncbi:MAG: RloB domain-containing protein [Spirochaetes bacterium]|nr:RloB domain-containing protein [Spirochaetota bacterium]